MVPAEMNKVLKDIHLHSVENLHNIVIQRRQLHSQALRHQTSPACILDAILTIEAHVPSVCPHRILQQAGGPKQGLAGPTVPRRDRPDISF